MPLTLSHPAASLPFAKAGLPISALVIGSLTPDLPYYVFTYSLSAFSHSIPGLVLFCLPTGLLVLILFQYVLKRPSFALLPSPLQRRLSGTTHPIPLWPIKRILLISLSIFIGATSHVLWDSFTHSYGWIVQHYSMLQTAVFQIGLHPVPVYEVLQHTSSLLGIALIMIWFLEWFRRTQPADDVKEPGVTVPQKSLAIIAMIATAFSAAVLTGVKDILPFSVTTFQRWSLFLGHIFIVTVSVLTAELVVFSLIWLTLQKQ